MQLDIIKGKPSNRDRDDILQLSELSFGTEAIERKRAAWDWMFSAPHVTSDQAAKTYMLRQQGQLVAVAILLPFVLKQQADLQPSYMVGFINVHPDKRGAGLRLMRQFLGEDHYLCGTPNSPKLVPLYGRFGTHQQTPLIRHFRPLRPGALLAKKLQLSAAVGTPVDLLWKLAGNLKLPNKTGTGSVQEIPRFDKRSDQLWQHIKEDFDLVFTRDAALLNWRYAEFPIPGYRLFYALDAAGSVQGHMVTKERRSNRRHQLSIVDLFCRPGDMDTFASLTRTAISLGTKRNVETLTALSGQYCWTTKAYKTAGLFTSRQSGAVLRNFDANGRCTTETDLARTPLFFTEGDMDTDF
ncbi:hypothetical protein [Leisingera sp. S232]|uniref:hypothetical protein n=1 Tax=Leisingera sp. S232 TaxID=3415132 RepID=UPI003C7E0C91